MILSQPAPNMQPLSINDLEDLRSSGLTEIPSNYVSFNAHDCKLNLGHELEGMAIFYSDKKGERIWAKAHGKKQQKPFIRFKPDWKKVSESIKEKYQNDAGELPKYLSQKGAGCRAYFSLFIKDWELKIKRAKDDLDFTEGEKKSDKACLEGFPTIGLAGVTCFVDKRIIEPIDNKSGSEWDVEEVEEQIKPDQSSFLPELEEIKWHGRNVGICYDSDIVHKFPVQQAFIRLFNEIYLRKGHPFPIFLPCELDGSKNGVDDFLVRHGKEAYEALRRACRDVQSSSMQMIETKIIKDKETGEVRKIDSHFKSLEPPALIKEIQAWAVLKESWAYRPGVGFYQWNDLHWQVADDDTMGRAITEFSDAQGWVKRSTNINSFLIKQLKQRLIVDELRWNNPNIMGFSNGYLDTVTNKLKSHYKQDYITQILPYDYDKTAKCPTWLNFINQALKGNKQLIDLLQAMFKWVLLPKNKAQVFPIQKIFNLIGRKGTGKGTALNILCQLVGEGNYGSASPKVFSNPETLGQLLDKKLAIDADATGYLEDIGNVNKVACNEAVAIRKLYVGSDIKRLNTVIVLGMNEFLKLPSSGTEGLDRRLLTIPFMVRPQRPDPDLFEKLSQEISGIFQWAWLPSFAEVKRRLLFSGQSQEVAEMAQERFLQDNPDFAFLLEHYPHGAMVKASLLYQNYKEWALESGLRAMSQVSFSSKLSNYPNFLKIRKSDGNYWEIPSMEKFNINAYLGIGEIDQPKEETKTYNFEEIIAKIDKEYERLGWDNQKKVDHLFEVYQVKKRLLLSDEQLVNYLDNLRQIETKTIDEIPEAKGFNNETLDISFGTVPDAPNLLNLLKEGQKTVTRRKWKDSYAKLFKKAHLKGEKIAVFNHKGDSGYQIGWLIVDKIYTEILENMPEEHLAKEGVNCSKDEFINRYFEGNNQLSVWVLEFKYYPLN